MNRQFQSLWNAEHTRFEVSQLTLLEALRSRLQADPVLSAPDMPPDRKREQALNYIGWPMFVPVQTLFEIMNQYGLSKEEVEQKINSQFNDSRKEAVEQVVESITCYWTSNFSHWTDVPELLNMSLVRTLVLHQVTPTDIDSYLLQHNFAPKPPETTSKSTRSKRQQRDSGLPFIPPSSGPDLQNLDS